MVKGHALLGRSVREHIEHDRRAAQMGDPMLRDQAENHGWLDLAQADLSAAGSHDGPGIRPTAAVEHRQRPQVDAFESEADVQGVAQRR
jgi:hypothetical protein